MAESHRAASQAGAPATPAAPEPPPLPEENPNRPREYHGWRTMVTALLIVGAAALAISLAVFSGGTPATEGDFGVAELPAYLNPAQRPVEVRAGALAPDLELETLNGERFRLSDWRGHPLVLNFWASWCGPCRRETPVLIRLQDEHRSAGLVVVGVNIEEARGPARGFADEFAINYRLPMDFSGSVTRRYFPGFTGTPRTYFIAPDGSIREFFVGQAPEAEVERATVELMRLIDGPLGPNVLPGPKALPTNLLSEFHVVGTRVGELAPDFVLPTEGSPARMWRLSDQRGRPLLLIFVEPGCPVCGVDWAIDAATRRRVDPVVITSPGTLAARAGGAPFTLLQWETETGSLFANGNSVQYAVVAADGVLRALSAANGEILQALEALAAEAAVPEAAVPEATAPDATAPDATVPDAPSS